MDAVYVNFLLFGGSISWKCLNTKYVRGLNEGFGTPIVLQPDSLTEFGGKGVGGGGHDKHHHSPSKINNFNYVHLLRFIQHICYSRWFLLEGKKWTISYLQDITSTRTRVQLFSTNSPVPNPKFNKHLSPNRCLTFPTRTVNRMQLMKKLHFRDIIYLAPHSI